MEQDDLQIERLNITNSKKEMLEAYKTVVKLLKEKRTAEMKPAEKIEEKELEKSVLVADSLSVDGIGREIGTLKSEIGKTLAGLSDRLESEIEKYSQVKKAVEARAKELQEIYEIEKSVSSLMALLEVQKQKRTEFEADMARQKAELKDEIDSQREAWKVEESAYEASIKERDAAEEKKRKREAEDYKYQFEREKQLARESFEYEKARMQRELEVKREEMEKDLSLREKALVEREAELQQLRDKVACFPQELDAARNKIAKEISERLTHEAKYKEDLLRKELDGEMNVLKSRLETLQQTLKEQTAQMVKMQTQLEKSYGQVQDIAVKAIEGSSSAKNLAQLQQQLVEQQRRPAPQEK